jgi:hypothetical protein
MQTQMVASGTEVLIGQEICDSYLENFMNRSGGFNLGAVKYEGHFSKNSNETAINELFVSIPVKNQEAIIVSTIENFLQNCKIKVILGFVFDNCTDESMSNVIKYFKHNFTDLKQVDKVIILSSKKELFESTCDNLLFKFCHGKYFMSLQSDIFFQDKLFLEKSLKLFNQIPNLFGISGRAVVAFSHTEEKQPFPIIKLFNSIFKVIFYLPGKKRLPYTHKNYNYFGDVSNFPNTKMHFTKREFHTLFIGDAIIRGPIIWDSKKFSTLGALNDVAFFLGRDDCDICLRANQKKWIVGYLPCKYVSDSMNGTSRKPKSIEVIESIDKRSDLSLLFPGELHRFWDRENSREQLNGQKTLKRVRIKELN